jgi:hypothetical protein
LSRNKNPLSNKVILKILIKIFFPFQDEGEIPSEEEKLEEGSRNIIFENVHFNYPARPDVNVRAKI